MSIRVAIYCLLFSLPLCYSCQSIGIQHPEQIEQAIVHFYNENENEKVVQILDNTDSIPLNNISRELIQILRAGALCELWLTDSSNLAIQALQPEKLHATNQGWYYSIKGLIQFRRSEIGEAYKSLITANGSKYLDPRSKALNERILARISFQLGEQDKGIEWLALSTQHFRELNLRKSVAVNEKTLGRYYMNNGNYAEAQQCFISAEKVFNEFHDHAELFYVYINLIDYHIKTKDFNQAECYAQKCLEQCKDVTDNSMKTLVYSNLGEIAMNRNNFDESIDYYTQTINAAPDFFTAAIRKTNAHLQLSRIYRQKKDFKTAEKHAIQASLLVPKNGHNITRRDIYQELALTQIGMNRNEQAMQYVDSASAFSDSTFNSISKANRAYYNTRAELIELSNNMEKLKQTEIRKRNTYIIFIAALIFLAIFILIIYFQQHSKNAVLKALARKNLDLLKDERKLNEMRQQEADQKKANRKSTGNGKSDQLFEQLNNWLVLNRNFARKVICLELVAKELGTNREYLSKAINEHNIRFNDLVNKYRVEETIRIFADKSDIRNKYGLLVISSEVGFNSNSVFIDAFRKYTGMTPAQFRDSLEPDCGG